MSKIDKHKPFYDILGKYVKRATVEFPTLKEAERFREMALKRGFRAIAGETLMNNGRKYPAAVIWRNEETDEST